MLHKVDRLLYHFENFLIAILCSIALFLGVMQVVLRYVFNTGFHWNEAIFVNLTVWAMLIGGSRAVRDGLHARVEIIASLLPERGVHICNLISLLLAFSLSAYLMYCGFLYTQFVHSMDISDIDSGIPDAITYAIVPLAMGLFIIRYFIKIVDWFHDPGEYGRVAEVDHGLNGD
jgi:TRAP-type C4-dicarboxylate transport system permease small subunit